MNEKEKNEKHRTLVARLSDYRVAKNARDYLVMYYLVRDLRAAIVQHAKGSVLDVGCGNKPYYSIFIDSGVTSYIGCDVVQSDKNRVDVLCPATKLQFSDFEFDTVFSTQVMEHVPHSDQMLAEANRVLKPGGKIILSVPFCWELHEEPHDYFRFSKYGMKELMQRNGFELLSVVPNGGKWAAIFQMNMNILYSTFQKKGLMRRFLKFLFINLRFTSIFNRIAIWLDRKHFDEVLTLNYVIVAQKEHR